MKIKVDLFFIPLANIIDKQHYVVFPLLMKIRIKIIVRDILIKIEAFINEKINALW